MEGNLEKGYSKRIKRLGFKPQKEIPHNRLLPYADELDEESSSFFADIKLNLGKAVMMREMKPGCGIWIARLARYIQLYGLKFSKEDHIILIKLMYECFTIPNLEPYLLSKFANVLIILLRKKLLSPDDIRLEWRPLYDVVKRTMDSNLTQLGMYRYFTPLEHTLSYFVHAARYYFPDNATQEILNESRPHVYPLSGNNSDFDVFEWFLPVSLPPSKAHMGYELWLKNVMDMLTTCCNGPSWESDAMDLISKLAWNNRGLIDWEPYIPDMFNRFLACLNLPVNYKNQMVKKRRKIGIAAMATWIVSVLGGGSECQNYLDKFLKAVETYFHPANVGRWMPKLKELLWKLPQYFVLRLHDERHRSPTWLNAVPDSHKLTEEDIDRFVASLKPIAMQSVFSKMGSIEVCFALKELATIRPKAICPDLIEKLYMTLDSLTEPNKLTCVMYCIAAVAGPMLQGQELGYTEGRLHVIPILMATLPGIDPNDFRKCLVTFTLIQNLVTFVPLVNCSKAPEIYTDLTEEEEELCIQSAGFEDFVCQFFDRVFVVIESSSLENTRLDKNEDKRSSLENHAESTLTSVCYSVLSQSSPEIFQAALKKLATFVTERIFEIKVAGRFVASLCSAFSRVNSVDTFKALLPHLCSSILLLTESEDILEEHVLDDELLYKLLILSLVVESKRDGLLEYMNDLTAVLDRCLFLVSSEGYAIAARLLKNIFKTLSNLNAAENRSVPYAYTKDFKDHLPIRDWGKSCDIYEANLTWHTPGAEEQAAAQALINRYLVPELIKIDSHIAGENVMTRTRLLISLHIIIAVQGAEPMLPLFQEDPLVLANSCLQLSPRTVTVGIKHFLTMPDGRNIRETIVLTLDKLQRHILKTAEDDTKALFYTVKILERILLNKMSSINYDSYIKNHLLVKKGLKNQLYGAKRRLRTLVINRVILLHAGRCENVVNCFTATHRRILINLLELACSQYSLVRSAAQASISTALDFFAYSYYVLVPVLVNNFKLNPIEAHETIKGSLYVVLGPKQAPLLTRHNWFMLLQLWPALVRCQPAEKLSVVKLMDSLKEAVPRLFPTITIDLDIPDRCVDVAKELWKNVPYPTSEIVSDAEIEEGRKALISKNEKNRQDYLSLLNTLCDAAEDNSLHWRHHSIAVCFIRDLIHPDILFTPRVVQLFLETLISDSIDLRKVAIKSVVHILKQQKRPHPKIDVDVNTLSTVPWTGDGAPGIRPDNEWLQYKYSTRPLSAKEWDEPRFKHERGYAYLYTPRMLKLYAPSCDQPCLDRSDADLLPVEKPIFNFFTNEQNVAKLMKYLAMEDKKGKDKFNWFHFLLFKGLFRNYGDIFLPYFKPYLDTLVEDKQESSQRCATEVIAGVIRGSKHWPYEKVEKLWEYLIPLIQKALTNITPETIQDWGICFATASQHRDPNRNHWLLECLMDVRLRNETSFLECCRFYVLQSALNQQEWRVSELSHRLLNTIIPYLDHPFENVRRRISGVLTIIFQSDVRMSGGKTLAPSLKEFMILVEKRLQILYSLWDTGVEQNEKIVVSNDNSDDLSDKLSNKSSKEDIDKNESKCAIRLFKTVLDWIGSSLTVCSSGVFEDHYTIYPLMCLCDTNSQDLELNTSCASALANMACVPLREQVISSVFAAIHKVTQSQSWWARHTNLDFLQVVIFHNMPLLRSQAEYADTATQVVLTAIKDSRVEVREKAAEVLAGLLHCDFIEDPTVLLKIFKSDLIQSCRHSRDSAKLLLRHSAILGLCAFVNSSPYDVPDCVPHIFNLLGNHLNDQQPIPSTIRKTLGDFKRTHHDNWESHKLKFTESQLEVFDDLTVPPAYCV